MKELGVYIHLPFCNSKCAYCDFASGVYSEEIKERYLLRLKEDIANFDFCGRTAVSVYFGGGTPSSLRNGYIADILDTLSAVLPFSNDVEITAECNPETFTASKAAEYSQAGINRLSFGLQTDNDVLLARIGRRHTASDFFDALSAARVYFTNINADIMLGLPGQTLADVEHTLNTLIKEDIPHISAYALKVEENTRLFKEKYRPDDDLCADMYDLAYDALSSHGLSRYEVRNFARRGMECRHNLLYWKRREYVGFGAAAHSFFDNTRTENPRSLKVYLSSDFKPISRYISPSGAEAAEETLMLALRTSDGLDIAEYNKTFGGDFVRDKTSILTPLTENGFLTLTEEKLRLTDKGFYVMNEIIVRLLGG